MIRQLKEEERQAQAQKIKKSFWKKWLFPAPQPPLLAGRSKPHTEIPENGDTGGRGGLSI